MSYIEFPLQFKRQYAGALDDGLVFNTYSALSDYIQNSNLAYAGQIVAVTDTDSLYFINNTVDGTVLVNTGTTIPEALDSVFSTVQSASGDWNSNYSTVNANSASWGIDTVYNDSLLQTTSGNWNSAYNELANIGLAGNNITNADVISANTIHSISAFTHYQDILVSELSGFSVEGDVSIAGQVGVTGTLSSNNIVYALNGDSAQWNSTYTTVGVNSASWGIDTGTTYDDSLLQSTSGDWDSTYTTVSANSASWGSGAVDSVNTKIGVVVLDADDIDDSTTTNKFATQGELDKANSALQPADPTLESVTTNGATTLNDINTGRITTGNNTAVGSNAIAIGGTGNAASGLSCEVLGGDGSTASGQGSTVLGGSNHTNSGNWSASVGGLNQTISSVRSGIFAGFGNTLQDADSTMVNCVNRTSVATNTLHTENLHLFGGFKMPTGAADTYVLTSDANGVGTWQAAANGNFCDTTLSLNQVSACNNDTITITGTVSSTNLITSTLSADSVFFNTGASHTPALGELVWDDAENTLDLGLTDGVVLQLGEEQLINVKAAEEIKNGQVVYASGAVGGASGKIEVSLYSASSAEGVVPGAVDELFFTGVATQDIALNNFGYITTFGKVTDVAVKQGNTIDTDIVGPENTNASTSDPGWELGTILYISTSAGRLTNTEPISPNKIVPAAMVIGVSGDNRTLFVRYEHGYHIDELHDVNINSISNNDILQYESSSNSWINTSNKISSDTSIAVSDETTNLTASTVTPLATFHAARDNNIEEVLLGVSTAPTGSTLVGDVHINGVSIFSTKPTIDVNEKTSVTAATQPVLSTTSYSKGDIIELYCDQVGSTITGTGLKFYFNQYYFE